VTLAGTPRFEASRLRSGQRVATAPERLAADLRMPPYRNGFALVSDAGMASALGFVFWAIAARHAYAACPVPAPGARSSALAHNPDCWHTSAERTTILHRRRALTDHTHGPGSQPFSGRSRLIRLSCDFRQRRASVAALLKCHLRE
jgi:hypothetical protein